MTMTMTSRPSRRWRHYILVVFIFCDLHCQTAARRRRGGYRHSRTVRLLLPKRRMLEAPPVQADSVDSFLSDLKKLKQFWETNIPILAKTHSNRDSSYTKSWTVEDWKGHQLPSRQRYSTHVRSWFASPTFQSTLPTLLVCLIWTLLCVVAFSQCRTIQNFVQQSPFSTSISSFSSPISILLALKTNRALNRLNEARNQWGIMIRVCTSLAGMVVNYVSPVDSQQGLLMGRYLAVFGWSMKGVLRVEDDSLVLQTILPTEEATWLRNCPGDHPNAIIFRLRNILASMSQENGNRLPGTASGVMEDRLEELEQAVGIIRRLMASPIPPTFTRMTSRTLCLFLFFLPLALISTGTNPFGILVLSMLQSYIFVGIDEISVEVENPFPLLPMFTLSQNLEENVGNQFAMQTGLQVKYTM